MAKDSQIQLAGGTSLWVKDEGRSQLCARILWALALTGRRYEDGHLCGYEPHRTSFVKLHLRTQVLIWQHKRMCGHCGRVGIGLVLIKRQASNCEPVPVLLWSLETYWNALFTELFVSKPGSSKMKQQFVKSKSCQINLIPLNARRAGIMDGGNMKISYNRTVLRLVAHSCKSFLSTKRASEAWVWSLKSRCGTTCKKYSKNHYQQPEDVVGGFAVCKRCP